MGRRFAVLVAGHPSVYVTNTFGGLSPLFVKFLGDPGDTWDTFSVVDGILPSEEEVQQFDGFVVTGSRHDAHGSEEWIQKLCVLLQKIHKKRKKLLGICFGHQIIGRALGGKTGRAPAGWDAGLTKVVFSDAILSKSYGHKLPRAIMVIEAHQDHVIELPPGGELLASSERTGIEMFAVGEHVLGIQGHPEFTEDILSNILDYYCVQGILQEETVNKAKVSLAGGSPDRDILQRLCKLFLKGSAQGSCYCHFDTVQGG